MTRARRRSRFVSQTRKRCSRRRAISVQLASVRSGQPRLLRVFKPGCSTASSAAIYLIPKPIVQAGDYGMQAEGAKAPHQTATGL